METYTTPASPPNKVRRIGNTISIEGMCKIQYFLKIKLKVNHCLKYDF